MTALQRKSDYTAQVEIGDALAHAFGVVVRHHFDQFAPIDTYALIDDRTVGYAEIKDRDHAAHFKTVYVSVRKWGNLHLYARNLKVAPLFVARFTDGTIRWLDVRGTGGDVWYRGRRDRGLNNDMEPMLEVPTTLFSILGDGRNPWM